MRWSAGWARDPATVTIAAGIQTTMSVITSTMARQSALSCGDTEDFEIARNAGRYRTSDEKFVTIPTAPATKKVLVGAPSRRSRRVFLPGGGVSARRRQVRSASQTSRTAAIRSIAPSMWGCGRWWGRDVLSSRPATEKTSRIARLPATTSQARTLGECEDVNASISIPKRIGLTAAPRASGMTVARRWLMATSSSHRHPSVSRPSGC